MFSAQPTDGAYSFNRRWYRHTEGLRMIEVPEFEPPKVLVRHTVLRSQYSLLLFRGRPPGISGNPGYLAVLRRNAGGTLLHQWRIGKVPHPSGDPYEVRSFYEFLFDHWVVSSRASAPMKESMELFAKEAIDAIEADVFFRLH